MRNLQFRMSIEASRHTAVAPTNSDVAGPRQTCIGEMRPSRRCFASNPIHNALLATRLIVAGPATL
jgi:hypothetical protein